MRKRKGSELPVFELPEELGNEYHLYRLRSRFRLKLVEEDCMFRGLPVKAGEYVGRGWDGGEMHLTEDELNTFYEVCGAE